MEEKKPPEPIAINLKWTVVTYCFLVLFHLTPSTLVLGTGLGAWNVFFRGSEHVLAMATWLMLGILLVNAYIGYRSKGATLIGSGLASSLYLLTVVFTTSTANAMPSLLHRILVTTLWQMVAFLGAFLLGCGGVAMGRWFRQRNIMRLGAPPA